MRKKFLSDEFGVDKAFWDKNWRSPNIKDAIKFCEISPLRPILDTYLPREGKILDAGCGLGQFVVYYKNRGYDIEGVDYTAQVIEQILAYDNTAKVCKADILDLFYPDNYFHVYYSGGVVEHFEDGPKQALREAHRVLNKRGVLIITVPYFNLFRRISSYLSLRFRERDSSGVKLDFNGMKTRFLLTDTHKRSASPFRGFSFHQYEYTRKEFSRILNDCGFNIIFSRGTSIAWGLMDNALLRKLINKALNKCQDNMSQKDPGDTKASESKAGGLSERARSYLKKILISEDYSICFGRLILKVLQYTCANLILFVCRVRK